MYQVIFEEFKGTGKYGNRLSRDVANHRIFPAIDIAASATRKSELLLTEEEQRQTDVLRKRLAGLGKVEAAKALNDYLRQYPANNELLKSLK